LLKYKWLTFGTDTKQTRIIKKTVPTDSFFTFFAPPAPPADDDDEEVDEEVEERLEIDYQLGEDIKEKLIPRAIDWFTGEALQYEQFDSFSEPDFEDEDDEDDEDSDERDEDEEDSDEDVSNLFKRSLVICNRALTHMQADGSKPKQEAAECKQS
jgi:nucleosome assembly protein 1-like 1